MTSRTEKLLAMLEAGKTEGITLDEFMQISFMQMIANDEVHLEQRVLYGGSVYVLHSCVQAINPGPQADEYRTKI